MTKFDYFMHLQFKFEIFHKIQRNKKKLTKYREKSQNCPKFEHGVLNNVGRPHKKMGQKKPKKKKNLPSAGPGTRQRGPLPSARKWHSAKKSFKKKQKPLPSAGPAQHSAKGETLTKLWAGPHNTRTPHARTHASSPRARRRQLAGDGRGGGREWNRDG